MFWFLGSELCLFIVYHEPRHPVQRVLLAFASHVCILLVLTLSPRRNLYHGFLLV